MGKAADEEVEEGEVDEKAEGVAAAPGPSTGAFSAAQDEGSSASAADSPHPELPASAGKSKDRGPRQDPAAPASWDR